MRNVSAGGVFRFNGGEGVVPDTVVPNKVWNFRDSITAGLNDAQMSNLERFADKLPANADGLRTSDLPNGGAVFQADSAAANVPGSFATYEKQVDALGNTVLYTKTTYAPDGSIVHIAPKYPQGAKIYPGL